MTKIIPPTDPDELKKWLANLVANSERIRKELTSPVDLEYPNGGRDFEGTNFVRIYNIKVNPIVRSSLIRNNVMCYR